MFLLRRPRSAALVLGTALVAVSCTGDEAAAPIPDSARTDAEVESILASHPGHPGVMPEQYTEMVLAELPTPSGLDPSVLGSSRHKLVLNQEALQEAWVAVGGQGAPPQVDFSAETVVFLAVAAGSDQPIHTAKGPRFYQVSYPAPRDGEAELRILRIPEPLAGVRVTPLR